ncbi:MAG: hypothetical protein GW893_01195 [Armatimonadetes bacterium]|nr:hypothetical protein [Armatimonadota bacterium]
MDRDNAGSVAEHPRNGGEHPDKGNLLAVRADQPARFVCSGFCFGHVHTSVCGRYFCCDEPRSGDIVVGSIRSGKHFVACNAGAITAEINAEFGQSGHAHPYLSPDLKWIVYNSCRTGRPAIHVASVPEELMAEVESKSRCSKERL